MHKIARHGLAGDVYYTPFAKRLVRRADYDHEEHEAQRRLWEEVMQDTEWAVTEGEPPDGWIPPKWVSRSK
jgi:hypothetical protein